MSAPDPRYAVRCVAHAHSTHSDGTATVPELRAAVRAAGATVLLLTDHDTLGAREAGEDGWGEGVLVVCGHEVTPSAGHLLVFATDHVIAHADRDERAILDAVAAAGGVAYAAHPFSAGSAMSTRIGRSHAWMLADHPALAGVEAWSLTTDAAEDWRSPLAALRGLHDPLPAVLAGPGARRLAAWDAQDPARARAGLPPLAGLGGQDAHAPGVRVNGRVRSIMPHERWLPLVQTVLSLDAPLGGDDRADEATVLRALRAGATAIAVPPLGDPLAARIDLSEDALRVEAPAGTRVRLVRDGAVVLDADADSGPWPLTGLGLHRAELWRPGPDGQLHAWLLGSPVRRGSDVAG